MTPAHAVILQEIAKYINPAIYISNVYQM